MGEEARTQVTEQQDRAASATAHACHYCGPTERELRPYGPGGATVCFPCMKADSEREKAAQGAFGALLDATSTLGLTAIGTEEGPHNVDPRDVGGAVMAEVTFRGRCWRCRHVIADDGWCPCDDPRDDDDE